MNADDAIISELQRGPLTRAELAYETGLMESSVRIRSGVLLSQYKRKMYIGDWEMSHKLQMHVPIFMAGNKPDVSLESALRAQGLGSTNTKRIIDALRKKNATCAELASMLNTRISAINNILPRLHFRGYVYIADFQKNDFTGRYLPIYALGAKEDAQHPAIHKRMMPSKEAA